MCHSFRGFLEVTAENSSQVLVLSFPSPYLGDKRTAFDQKLSLNLSFPALEEVTLEEGLRASLEGVTSMFQLRRFEFELKVNATASPQLVEVRTSCDTSCY